MEVNDGRRKDRYPPHRGGAHVPAGTFLYGRSGQSVFIPGFYIDKFPVTNQAYGEFVRATGHRAPSHWPDGAIPPGLENHPVVSISWHDAQAYAVWCGKDLPSEAQWEKSARGVDGRIFPWGNAFSSRHCNTEESGIGHTTAVDAYPSGVSPFGVFDLSGCGGNCGECGGGTQCNSGSCECVPQCVGVECGADGCGGSCGTCEGMQEQCQAGSCVCIPDCAGIGAGSRKQVQDQLARASVSLRYGNLGKQINGLRKRLGQDRTDTAGHNKIQQHQDSMGVRYWIHIGRVAYGTRGEFWSDPTPPRAAIVPASPTAPSPSRSDIDVASSTRQPKPLRTWDAYR